MKDAHYAKRDQRRNFFWSEYGPENAPYLDTFRAVACRANQKNPGKCLFKKGFNKKKFRSISTDWGYMHKYEARAAYVDVVSNKTLTFFYKNIKVL